VPAKLAFAYRETGQWEKAGDELNLMVAMATTPEERRENLQIAAELYDQAGNEDKAIDTWRQYANGHPEPAADYMEAANRLAELYESRGDFERRDFWLNRQMEKVDRNPEAADDRMRYLAASATFAREALAYYDSIRLTLPLNESMVAKSNALEDAVQAYPFEDSAIDIHEQNIHRAREGIFDEWVQRSYESLRRSLPGRYNKPEVTAGAVHDLG